MRSIAEDAARRQRAAERRSEHRRYGGASPATGGASTVALTLTWDAIHAVRPIEAEAQGSGRMFRAEFYDAVGNRATQDITVTLQCVGGQASCGAGCVNNVACDEVPPSTYNGYYFNNMACTCSDPRPTWWASP